MFHSITPQLLKAQKNNIHVNAVKQQTDLLFLKLHQNAQRM